MADTTTATTPSLTKEQALGETEKQVQAQIDDFLKKLQKHLKLNDAQYQQARQVLKEQVMESVKAHQAGIALLHVNKIKPDVDEAFATLALSIPQPKSSVVDNNHEMNSTLLWVLVGVLVGIVVCSLLLFAYRMLHP